MPKPVLHFILMGGHISVYYEEYVAGK
jgi:hypothetical protein